MATTIVLLTMETRNFTFDAAGATREEALWGLLAAWSVHRAQYSHKLQPLAREDVLERAFGINERTLRLGAGYRDNEALTT